MLLHLCLVPHLSLRYLPWQWWHQPQWHVLCAVLRAWAGEDWTSGGCVPGHQGHEDTATRTRQDCGKLLQTRSTVQKTSFYYQMLFDKFVVLHSISGHCNSLKSVGILVTTLVFPTWWLAKHFFFQLAGNCLKVLKLLPTQLKKKLESSYTVTPPPHPTSSAPFSLPPTPPNGAVDYSAFPDEILYLMFILVFHSPSTGLSITEYRNTWWPLTTMPTSNNWDSSESWCQNSLIWDTLDTRCNIIQLNITRNEVTIYVNQW